MTDHPITVLLPDSLFDPMRQVAEARAQTLEQVVVDQLRSVASVALPSLPVDEESELVAFRFLSADTLRNIVREQMPRRIQDRMQNLMDANTMGTISSADYTELSEYVERGQRLMLRKAWAAGVLMERGHPITEQDMTPEDA